MTSKFKKRSLTDKKKAFILKYVECNCGVEAYEHAYNTENMQRATMQNNSGVLLREEEVQQEIKALNKVINAKVIQRTQVDREYITNGIIDCIKQSKFKDDYNTALRGYGMLAQLFDINEDKINDRGIITKKEQTALMHQYNKRMQIEMQSSMKDVTKGKQ